MHDPNTICPRHPDGRGIKKKNRGGGGDGGGSAENPNLKKQKFFWVAGKGATRVSE